MDLPVIKGYWNSDCNFSFNIFSKNIAEIPKFCQHVTTLLLFEKNKKIFDVKFWHYEKATKIWNNLPLDLTFPVAFLENLNFAKVILLLEMLEM